MYYIACIIIALPSLSEGVSKALREAEVQLLEPCTNMVVMVPEEHLGTVLSDLTSQRRGQVQVKEVGSIQDNREITAVTPLQCLKYGGITTQMGSDK